MSPVQGSWYYNPQQHSQQRLGRQQQQQQQQQQLQQEGVWWDVEGGGGWEGGGGEGEGVDIVALLIGIFGSKDVFVSEYRWARCWCVVYVCPACAPCSPFTHSVAPHTNSVDLWLQGQKTSSETVGGICCTCLQTMFTQSTNLHQVAQVKVKR
eukprot:1153291-Pelagomonas_calceolata.AAC.3